MAPAQPYSQLGPSPETARRSTTKAQLPRAASGALAVYGAQCTAGAAACGWRCTAEHCQQAGSQPAGVLVVDGAARAPDGAVGLKAAAKAELPQAVATLHANRVLHVGQNVPAGRPHSECTCMQTLSKYTCGQTPIRMYLRADPHQHVSACIPESRIYLHATLIRHQR